MTRLEQAAAALAKAEKRAAGAADALAEFQSRPLYVSLSEEHSSARSELYAAKKEMRDAYYASGVNS